MSDLSIAGTFEEAREATRRPVRRLAGQYVGPYVPKLAVGVLARMIDCAVAMFFPLVLAVTIDAVFFGTEPFRLPLLPDAWVPSDPLGQLWLAAGIYLGLRLVQTANGWFQNWIWHSIATDVRHDIRTDAYETVQRLELGFFEDQQTGQVMSVLDNDVRTLGDVFTGGLMWLVIIGVYVPVVFAYMAYLNWQLAVLVMSVWPVVAVLNLRLNRTIESIYDEVQDALGRVNARFQNNVGGIDVVKTSVAETDERERVREASRTVRDANLSAVRVMSVYQPTQQFIMGLNYTIVLVVGGYWVLEGPPFGLQGTMTAGALLAFLLYLSEIRDPIMKVTDVVDSYNQVKAAAKRVLAIQDFEAEQPEPADAFDLDSVVGEVEFEDVTFTYPNADERALDAVDFEVKASETIGIVGKTGAGKSTILKLLLRFYDPNGGTIRIDGHDVREVTRRSLRESIGYVSQEPYIFHGTVRENIAYPNVDVSDAEIEATAKRARCHGFIVDLPDGYDTIVGERGVKLSGGQRQRLAIARALLLDPEILVFDEATSHVDNRTEVLIKGHLTELTADRTTFLVAHRLSTVRNADRILVIDDGQIIEQGTHEELLATDGVYADLWRVQAGNVEFHR